MTFIPELLTSVIVFAGLIRRKKKQHLLNKLRRRRPAFSGQSGGPHRLHFLDNRVSQSFTNTVDRTSLHTEKEKEDGDEGETDMDVTQHAPTPNTPEDTRSQDDVENLMTTLPPEEGHSFQSNGIIPSQATADFCNGITNVTRRSQNPGRISGPEVLDETVSTSESNLVDVVAT